LTEKLFYDIQWTKNPTFTKALNSQKSIDAITCFLILEQKLALRKHTIINANAYPCARPN